MRIVSLLPAATDLVVALGMGAHLVGRSHECDHPAVAQLPALTEARIDSAKPSAAIHDDVSRLVRNALSLYVVDEAALARLRPDIVLTQDQCHVCAVDLVTVERAVQRATAGATRIVSLRPDSLADVFADWRRVGDALGVPDRAQALVADFERRAAAIRARLREARPARPRALCLEWTQPPMSAGNWVPELVRKAGGDAVLATAGAHSPVTTWDAIGAADPDIVIVMLCGFGIARSRRELAALESLSEWRGLRAVREGRVFVADGNLFFNRPGPGTTDTLEALAQMIHPELFPALTGVWESLRPVRRVDAPYESKV